MFAAREVGLAIKRLRGSRPQNEVARRGGVDPSTWSLYESGKRRPRGENLEKIAKGLGCTVSRLEEETWQVHRELVTAREAAAKPAAGAAEPGLHAPGQAEPVDPLQRGIDEHVTAISHHLRELILLATNRKP